MDFPPLDVSAEIEIPKILKNERFCVLTFCLTTHIPAIPYPLAILIFWARCPENAERKIFFFFFYISVRFPPKRRLCR